MLDKANKKRVEVGSPDADQSTIKLVSDLAIQIDANNNKGDSGNGGDTNGGNGGTDNTGGDTGGDGGNTSDPDRFNDDDGAFQMGAMAMALTASVAAIAF